LYLCCCAGRQQHLDLEEHAADPRRRQGRVLLSVVHVCLSHIHTLRLHTIRNSTHRRQKKTEKNGARAKIKGGLRVGGGTLGQRRRRAATLCDQTITRRCPPSSALPHHTLAAPRSLFSPRCSPFPLVCTTSVFPFWALKMCSTGHSCRVFFGFLFVVRTSILVGFPRHQAGAVFSQSASQPVCHV